MLRSFCKRLGLAAEHTLLELPRIHIDLLGSIYEVE